MDNNNFAPNQRVRIKSNGRYGVIVSGPWGDSYKVRITYPLGQRTITIKADNLESA